MKHRREVMRCLVLGLGFSLIMVALPSGASANCDLVSGPCYEDSSGNAYVTEQSLGGGYNTYRGDSLYSQTQQDLNGGGYTERYVGGGSKSYNYDPYAPPRGFGSGWSGDEE